MKNILTVCILVLYCAMMSAQYAPTAVEGANWVILDGNGLYGQDGNLYRDYILSIRGDSIINDTAYKKLYIREYDFTGIEPRDATPPYIIRPGRALYALLRDDTLRRSVYGRVPENIFMESPLTADVLIHNYNAGVSDTITGYYFSSPMPIDSVFYEARFGQTFRIQQHLEGGPLDQFYEGLGMIGGGPLTYFSTTRYNDGNPLVVDYCIGSDEECAIDFVNSISTTGQLLSSIYPSLVKSTIQLEFSSPLASPVGVWIINLEGQVLLHRKWEHAKHNLELDASQLPSGNYFIRIKCNNKYGLHKFEKIN